MLGERAFELRAVNDVELASIIVTTDALEELFGERFSNEPANIGSRLRDQDVVDVRIVGDRLIDWDRPGRGCPDDCARVEKLRDWGLNNSERDIDLGRRT
jgi:hypothetical protein